MTQIKNRWVIVLVFIASFTLGGFLGAMSLAYYSAKHIFTSESAKVVRTINVLNLMRAGNTNEAIQFLEYELTGSVITLLQADNNSDNTAGNRSNAALTLAESYLLRFHSIDNGAQVNSEVWEALKRFRIKTTNGMNNADLLRNH